MTKCQFCLFVNHVPEDPEQPQADRSHYFVGLCGKPTYGPEDSEYWDSVLYKWPNGTVVLLTSDYEGLWTESSMTFEFCPKCGRRLNA